MALQNKIWRWESEYNGWLYRVEMIPCSHSSTPSLDELESAVHLIARDTIISVGDGQHGWESIALSLPDSGTVKIKLLYSAFTEEEQEIISNPEYQADGQMRVCNVWRIVSDEGTTAKTGTTVWTPLFEGGQRRGAENVFEESQDGRQYYEIELFDILRTILERIENKKGIDGGGLNAKLLPSSSAYYEVPGLATTDNSVLGGNVIEYAPSTAGRMRIAQVYLANTGYCNVVFMPIVNIQRAIGYSLGNAYANLVRSLTIGNQVSFAGDGLFSALRYYKRVVSTSTQLGTLITNPEDLYVVAMIIRPGVSNYKTTQNSVIGGLMVEGKEETLLEKNFAFDLLRDLAESQAIKLTYRTGYETIDTIPISGGYPKTSSLTLYASLIENTITQTVKQIDVSHSLDNKLRRVQGRRSIRSVEVQMKDFPSKDKSEYAVELAGSNSEKQLNIECLIHNSMSSETDENSSGSVVNAKYLTVRGIYHIGQLAGFSINGFYKVHEKTILRISNTVSYESGTDFMRGVDGIDSDTYFILKQQQDSSCGAVIAKAFIDLYGKQNQMVVEVSTPFIPGVLMPYHIGEMYEIDVPRGMSHLRLATLVDISDVNYLQRTMKCVFLQRGT